MRVTFLRLRSGEVEIRWNLIGGPPAREVATVRPWRFVDGGHLLMCSWCKDVHLEKTWLDLEAAAPLLGLLDHCRLPPITHGICPDCRATLETEVVEPLAERVAS
jgi:hypothetical protein